MNRGRVTKSNSGEQLVQTELTLPAAPIAAGAVATVTAALVGARIGDHVVVSSRVAPDGGLSVMGGVYADDTVSITATTGLAAGVTPGAPRVFSVLVLPAS